MCCDLLGASVFRCPLCLLGTRGCVCFMHVYMSVSCSRDLLSMCCFLWWSECVYLSKCVWQSDRGVGVFEGDVPLPRVFSFLSFMLMASDAPSGICEEREEEGKRDGGKTREDRGHGVRGESGGTRTASLSKLSRGAWCWEVHVFVYVRVCWSCVHLEWWQVCGSLTVLIKVDPQWNGLNSLASEPGLLVHAAAHCFHSSVPMAQQKLNRALNKYR